MVMARYGEARTPEPEAASVHLGFKSDGGLFRSEVPVTNAITGQALELVRLVAAGDAVPADVVLALTTKPEWFVKLWPASVVGSWATLDRMEQWPCAYTSNSLHQCVKHGGVASPLWLRDENAWQARCDRWEQVHSAESRYAHAADRMGVLEGWLGGGVLRAAREALDKVQRGMH